MNYRLEKKEAFWITGIVKSLHRQLEENMQIVPGMWEDAVKDGTIEKLCHVMEQDRKGILGVSICNDQEEWRYMIAAAGEKKELAGMETYEVPAHIYGQYLQGKGSVRGQFKSWKSAYIQNGCHLADMSTIAVRI